MSKTVSIKEASKTDWFAPIVEGRTYPGDTNIQLGCLMRIATATEVMAKNYTDMERSLKYYKERTEELLATRHRLEATLKATRGHNTRLNNILDDRNKLLQQLQEELSQLRTPNPPPVTEP